MGILDPNVILLNKPSSVSTDCLPFVAVLGPFLIQKVTKYLKEINRIYIYIYICTEK